MGAVNCKQCEVDEAAGDGRGHAAAAAGVPLSALRTAVRKGAADLLDAQCSALLQQEQEASAIARAHSGAISWHSNPAAEEDAEERCSALGRDESRQESPCSSGNGSPSSFGAFFRCSLDCGQRSSTPTMQEWLDATTNRVRVCVVLVSQIWYSHQT